jgi:hypothetical protein
VRLLALLAPLQLLLLVMMVLVVKLLLAAVPYRRVSLLLSQPARLPKRVMMQHQQPAKAKPTCLVLRRPLLRMIHPQQQQQQ